MNEDTMNEVAMLLPVQGIFNLAATCKFYNESKLLWRNLLNKEFNIQSEEIKNLNNPKMVYFHLKHIVHLKHYPTHKSIFEKYINAEIIKTSFLKILDEHTDKEWEDVLSHNESFQNEVDLIMMTLNHSLVEHFLEHPSEYPALKSHVFLNYLMLSGNKAILDLFLHAIPVIPSNQTLEYALMSGSIEIVNYMRNNYKSIILQDEEYIAFGCKSGSVSLVKYLIEDLRILPDEESVVNCLLEAVRSTSVSLCAYLLTSKMIFPILSKAMLSTTANFAASIQQNEIFDLIQKTYNNFDNLLDANKIKNPSV